MFPSVTCSSHTVPSRCAASPHFVDTTHSMLRQPPSWPLPAVLMPWSLHLFVHGLCKFFFFIVLPLLTPASLSLHATSALSCHICSCAASVLPCRFFTPTRTASTPLPLAYPGCIDILTYACRVGCLGPHRRPCTTRCALRALCPHPLLRPCHTLYMHL